jgi:hypothetical protein
MHTNSATIEIAKPRLFTAGAVAIVSAYGILLATPFLISVLVISVIKFGILTVLIPLLVVAATAYFLPLNPAAAKDVDGFIVQLTLSPRLRTGLRALLEDADDIGYLSFTGTGLLFQGDSVKLTIPFDRIQQVRPQNIGLRGLFVYGRRIRLVVSDLPQAEAFEFAERSSFLLPTSRSITRKLHQRLSTKAPPETTPGGSSGTSL